MALVRVDDQDPRIVYTGAWFGDIDPKNTQGYNHTQHLTRVIGSSASFTFSGTQVSVIGSYGGVGPTSQYSIDDGPDTTYKPSVNASTEVYGQTFYKSPQLSAGEHKLNLQVVAGDWYWLDEITYVPLPAKPPIGAIVGGVIGGLIIIAAAMFLYLRWRKRSRLSRVYSPVLQAETGDTRETQIVPFNLHDSSSLSHPDSFNTKHQPSSLGLPSTSSTSSQSSPLPVSDDYARYVPSSTSATHETAHAIVPFNLYETPPHQESSNSKRQPLTLGPPTTSSSSQSSSVPAAEYSYGYPPIGTNVTQGSVHPPQSQLHPIQSYPGQPQSKRLHTAQIQEPHIVVRHADDAGVRIAGGPSEAPPTVLELPPMYTTYTQVAS